MTDTRTRTAARRGVRAAVAMSLAMVLAVPAAPSRASDGCTIRSSEKTLMRKINARRGQHNVRRLKLDLRLTRVARHHSTKMVRRGGLYHALAHNMGHIKGETAMGEILTRVPKQATETKTVGRVLRAYMGSSLHRGILLDGQWTHVGAGLVKSGGSMWATVLFYKGRARPGTNLHRC